jgi:Flp pilus assembly protein CpaB
VKSSVVLFFTILGIFATFLLCAGASLVGVTMSYARPYRGYGGGWNDNPTPKTSVVLVARQDIPAGTKIGTPELMFRVRIYRLGEEPRDGVNDYSQIGGMFLTREMKKGEACTLGHLKTPIPLPDGKRAFSFRTMLNLGMDGFIAPGSRVDVSGQAPVDNVGQSVFKVLAQDCVVLAVNAARLAPEDPEMPQVMPANQPGNFVTLTVAISPEEAVALIGSMRQGQLTVTLRAPKE